VTFAVVVLARSLHLVSLNSICKFLISFSSDRLKSVQGRASSPLDRTDVSNYSENFNFTSSMFQKSLNQYY